MDRRKFLVGASGVLFSDVSSCTQLPKLKPTPTHTGQLPDMDEYIARVDGGMESIPQWSPTDQFPAYAGNREVVDQLGRKSLRTLESDCVFIVAQRELRHLGHSLEEALVGS